ncbi:hypothetical protein [Amycolatopsis sp. NPDC098790]|uniref:hypothetical protein n=1 Tax=Amycolatopsis sp. NPDC098790 TaxID=3363939 RepID=UPI0037F2421C
MTRTKRQPEDPEPVSLRHPPLRSATANTTPAENGLVARGKEDQRDVADGPVAFAIPYVSNDSGKES